MNPQLHSLVRIRFVHHTREISQISPILLIWPKMFRLIDFLDKSSTAKVYHRFSVTNFEKQFCGRVTANTIAKLSTSICSISVQALVGCAQRKLHSTHSVSKVRQLFSRKHPGYLWLQRPTLPQWLAGGLLVRSLINDRNGRWQLSNPLNYSVFLSELVENEGICCKLFETFFSKKQFVRKLLKSQFLRNI